MTEGYQWQLNGANLAGATNATLTLTIRKGVKFSDVRPDSPAAKAGFKAGDVLVQFGGKPIDNLYDFTYALRSKQPGDKVQVKVIRDGKTIEESVLLTRRP